MKIFTHLNTRLHLIIIIAFASVSASAQGFSPETQKKLQDVIETFQNSPQTANIGGISAAINVDGLASWNGAAGYAARNIDAQNNLLPGGTPFTTDTLSRIYSVTKTFTAALVLELAKDGAFNLEEPVSKYLPLLNAVNPTISSSVTIRQLLAHESGYSDYTNEMNLQVAVAFDPKHKWTPYEMISFVHQLVPPGAERRYSSTNYILLGAIIEAATGKPVEQHFRKRFFKPLELSSMFLAVREMPGSRGNLASPHDNISAFNPIFFLTGQPVFPDAYTNISRFPFDAIVSLAFTGGGIVSNASDLAEWGNALFGGRATSKSTLNAMLNSISDTTDEDGDKLGYGIFTNTRISATDKFIGHNGKAPGYQSVMFYQPDRKMTITVLTNFYGNDPYAIAKKLYEALPAFTCENQNRKEDKNEQDRKDDNNEHNKKENKIEICFKGKSLCISRSAVPSFLKKGAYLGGCGENVSKLRVDKIILEEPAERVHDKLVAQDKLIASPNPFTSYINFTFDVVQTGPVSLKIFDMQGKLVVTLFSGTATKGMNRQVRFDAGNLPAGIYIGHLQTGSGISEQKLVLRR